MAIKSRLGKLEKAANDASESERSWAYSKAYARLRRDVQVSIDSDLAIGEEPLYWIDDEGIVRATDNDSLVRHMDDYIQALDRRIARLECEIAEERVRTDEARANMSPEEVRRVEAEDAEFLTSLEGLSLDEPIRGLRAEIAAENAEKIAKAEGGGGNS